MYDGELVACGLRITQYSLLAVLERLGAATVQELAATLVMDRSTLGHNLRPLERDGLVELGEDRGDRRARSLRLTARGQARLRQARPHWARAQARFHEAFGAKDARDLRERLRRASVA
jgi:DNA-binding MarR family transcriptional regulator